ncbi:MAG: hypothetical protein Q8P88_02705 [Candidatus Jorgensenbacteria bacterium]|nr:hypothetical protein [Candidatus Jorgensenbacteria bacterium]
MRIPKSDARYAWTHHAVGKMYQYGIGEGRVKRIIRYPKRTEEGIAEDTVAVMQPAGTKHYQELWVMYRIEKSVKKGQKPRLLIITAWRYPGESPARNPVPKEIMDEIRTLL